MAEKIGAPEKTAKRPPKTHNVAELPKKLEPFLKEIMKAYDALEEDHGSHILSINHKFEKISETIGFPKSLIRTHVAKIRRSSKEADTLKEMDDDDLAQEIELQKGWAGTSFAAFTSVYLEKLEAEQRRRAKQ
jgi:uncharacterized protein YukE